MRKKVKYIKHILYKWKLTYELENNKVKRNDFKITMNSLCGKFAKKLMNIVLKDDINYKNLNQDSNCHRN